MLAKLIAEALRSVGVPFHGKIPKIGSWSHFHDSPTKRSGPYFIRLNRVQYGSKRCLLLIAGDMRKSPPTLIRKLFDEAELRMIDVEQGALTGEIKKFEEELAQKQALKHDTAALEAERIWKLSSESGSTSYMRNKNIDQLYGCRISPYGDLVIPLVDIHDRLWNLQLISKPGDRGKYFLRGAKKRGCFHLIGGEIKSRILVVEGFATGVSVHKATGELVCVAIDAGNLKSVSTQLKKKFKGIPITICADQDEAGLQGAKAAAMTVGGEIIVPNFGFHHPDYKDFNDMELNEIHGGVAVKDQFNSTSEKKAKSFSYSKQDWLQEYLEKKEIEFLYDGRVLEKGSDLRISVLRARMYLAAEKEGLKIGEKMIDSFLTDEINSVKIETWKEVSSRLCKVDPLGIEEVKAFLIATTGRVEEESLSVFLHMIWQVKNKMIDRKVDHHMMLVFEGETGGGKSEAILKLLAPLSPLHQRESMDALSDQRRWDIFDRYLVLNMDEMERADRTDLAGLKRTITSDTLTYRVLGTHLQQTVPNRTTLIGSTNMSLSELIKDPTSIRRFYSIETLNRAEMPLHWEMINRLDYVKLWSTVDPMKPTPLASNLRAIQDKQEDMRFKDAVELWAEEFHAASSETRMMPTNHLYERSFKNWCNESGMMVPSKIHFARRLSKLGYKPSRTKATKGFLISIEDPRLHM